MILLLASLLAHGAEEWRLVDAQPKHDRHSVLLVVTPGYDPAAYQPLADHLVKKGRDVRLLSFECLPSDGEDLVRQLTEAGSTLPEGYTVVAHGVGALLPLMADARLKAAQYVFLGPVLDMRRSAALDLALETELGAQADLTVSMREWTSGRKVDLSVKKPFGDADLATVLLGEDPPLLDCVAGPFAAELQDWMQSGERPVDYAQIGTPVWIGVGLLDRIAPTEVVVPTSRAFPNRKLVRLGITRLDKRDLDHLGLLRDKIAAKAAAKAIKKGAGR